jgi:hypothetical protein
MSGVGTNRTWPWRLAMSAIGVDRTCGTSGSTSQFAPRRTSLAFGKDCKKNATTLILIPLARVMQSGRVHQMQYQQRP